MVKEKPVHKVRIGYVTATVWKNGDYHSVVLSRAYKDGDEWKETDSLGHGDIANAMLTLQRAEQFVAEQE